MIIFEIVRVIESIKEPLFEKFFIFGALALIGFVILLKILPETKGKSLEDIEHDFIKN